MRHALKQWGVKVVVALSAGLGAWTSGEAQCLTWLGTLGGASSRAWGVSADGRVVVGVSGSASGQSRASRWIEGRGMQDLNQVFAALLANGSYLSLAHAISPDGRYIVGWGINAATWRTEAFLLDTRITGDVDGNGCVDDTDLLQVLSAFGQSGSTPADVNGDGVVDDADLLAVLFNFRQGC